MVNARAGADDTHMIWPVAALAVLLLCFVIGYGTRLQARVDSRRDSQS
jgi:hypothetical protein